MACAGCYAPAPTERVHVVHAWLQQLLLQRVAAGGIAAPPAQHGRLAALLTDAMSALGQCRCASLSDAIARHSCCCSHVPLSPYPNGGYIGDGWSPYAACMVVPSGGALVCLACAGGLRRVACSCAYSTQHSTAQHGAAYMRSLARLSATAPAAAAGPCAMTTVAAPAAPGPAVVGLSQPIGRLACAFRLDCNHPAWALAARCGGWGADSTF